jgi:hypothetical protein
VAERLGCTVAEAQERMDRRALVEQAAYMRESPDLGDRLDYWGAMICWTVRRLLGRRSSLKPQDLLPPWQQRRQASERPRREIDDVNREIMLEMFGLKDTANGD